MPVTKDDVIASLNKVAGAGRTPLPKTGTLSEIVANDGKVFFSITVDSAVVQAWESVRKRAEEAVKAIPGIQSVMVALTAERKAGAPAAARPPQGGAPAGGGPRSRARPCPAARAAGRAGRECDHRGGVREGRRRQVDDRDQSGARLRESRDEGRRARRRYLRAVAAQASGHQERSRKPSTANG